MTPILPPKLAHLVESIPVLTPALRAAGTWLEARAADVLVLQGDTGSGKSIAAAWGFEFAAHRSRVRPLWCDAPALCALAEWSPEWSAFDVAPLVVIDDLGTETKPERMTVILERLFNTAAGRAIITTNIGIDEAFVRYGRRVESRMRGSATWVPLADGDYRITPPEGARAPLPSADTRREVAAKQHAAEERRRQEAAEEAARAESERLGREAMAELSRLTARFTSEQRAQSDASDEERRQELQRQVEDRRAAAEAAEGMH